MSGQELPDGGALDEFKNQVRIWMELDNSIKQLQQLSRERRAFKKQLTDKILEFMSRYNIDDLNTKDGRLLYKMKYVRAPLPQRAIRERIESELNKEVPDKCLAITTVIFDRDKKQLPSLRRLKVT